MTAKELRTVLSKINLQELTDEELSEFRTILSLKESQVRWVITCRKRLKTRFPGKKK